MILKVSWRPNAPSNRSVIVRPCTFGQSSSGLALFIPVILSVIVRSRIVRSRIFSASLPDYENNISRTNVYNETRECCSVRNNIRLVNQILNPTATQSTYPSRGDIYSLAMSYNILTSDVPNSKKTAA